MRILSKIFRVFLLPSLTGVALPSCLHAQEPAAVITHLSITQRLSHHNVKCIFQDGRMFLWLSTLIGLNRYDGYMFKVYKHGPAAGGEVQDLKSMQTRAAELHSQFEIYNQQQCNTAAMPSVK